MFLVDEQNEQVYWAAPLKEIDNKDLSSQDTYTFHISLENYLDRNSIVLPEDFVFEIIRYYAIKWMMLCEYIVQKASLIHLLGQEKGLRPLENAS